MPFLMDGGPPVSTSTIENARNELPREYGLMTVQERGRRALVVRVPRGKPDYNFELQEVALYAGLDDLKDVKDVLLVGDQKAVRMDPVRLRDHVRDQIDEDTEIAKRARGALPRSGDAWAVVPSEILQHHRFLVIRLAVDKLGAATEADFKRAKAALGSQLVSTLREVHGVVFVTNTDYGRVGRRLFIEHVAPEVAAEIAPHEGETTNPSHLAYATAGGTLTPDQRLDG